MKNPYTNTAADLVKSSKYKNWNGFLKTIPQELREELEARVELLRYVAWNEGHNKGITDLRNEIKSALGIETSEED